MTPEASRDYTGRRVVVMGLGRFGGGVGVSRWLAGQGAHVTVTDLASADELRESIAALEDLPIQYRLDGHDPADLKDCDLVVVNPAVDKHRSDFFSQAVARGVSWTTENNLFLQRCPALLVGVTGSVGKSTTTAMIGAILEAAAREPEWTRGRVWLGGNIGRSLLSGLDEMSADDVVVLELSSFQLEDTAAVRRSPEIAVLTNLRPNHLDRHGTMEHYAAAKRNIFAFQQPGDVAVLPPPELLAGDKFVPATGVHDFVFSLNHGLPSWRVELSHATILLKRPKLHVPGEHNMWNAAAALAATDALDVPRETALAGLAEFRGLPHRLEFVREYGRVRYFNDSKATSPDAAITALESFDTDVVIVCGGYDKGIAFDELGRRLVQRAKAVICCGDTRAAICDAIRAAAGDSKKPRVENVAEFEAAVNTARRCARVGDVVVLSPACASYDQFRNYEARGEAFKRIVNAWE